LYLPQENNVVSEKFLVQFSVALVFRRRYY